MGIFIEGLPFILLGALLSSLLYLFIQEETIRRFFPKKASLAIPFASLLGMLIPICECGIVPIARRLIQKGLPAYVAITFLLAAPIVNPITIFSTYFAFGEQGLSIVLWRIGLGIAIAMIMGAFFCLFFANKQVLKEQPVSTSCHCCHQETQHDHHPPSTQAQATIWSRGKHAFYHAVFEWIEMGKLFILGALIAAFFHTVIGVSTLQKTITEDGWAILLFMFLAFALSICSSADAFVAASFRSVAHTGPLLAFLVFGPMIDLKNLLMMSHSFRLPVVITFSLGTTILTFLTIWLIF